MFKFRKGHLLICNILLILPIADNYTGSEEEKLKTEIKLLKKTIDDSKVQFNLAAEARHEGMK